MSRWAALLSLDPTLQIVCRFTWLHTRCLLDIQKQLQALEDQLTHLDREESRRRTPPEPTAGSPEPVTASSPPTPLPPRPAYPTSGVDVATRENSRETLMSLIQEKLRLYGELTEQQHNMIGYGRPSHLGLYNMRSFRKRLGTSLDEKDYEWLQHGMQRKDLATLSRTGFSALFDSTMKFIIETIPLRVSCKEKV